MNGKILLRPVDKSNYLECINLSVDESQKNYVAPNSFSLVQAAYEPELFPLAVYNEDEMVGFILYDFDYELMAWSMSRFMIDKKYQGKGFGKTALDIFLNYFFEKYNASKLYTSAEVDNTTAIKLYEAAGFEQLEAFEYEVSGVHFREMRMVLKK